MDEMLLPNFSSSSSSLPSHPIVKVSSDDVANNSKLKMNSKDAEILSKSSTQLGLYFINIFLRAAFCTKVSHAVFLCRYNVGLYFFLQEFQCKKCSKNVGEIDHRFSFHQYLMSSFFIQNKMHAAPHHLPLASQKSYLFHNFLCFSCE